MKKTPRDLLLSRHAAAVPRLDTLRRSTLDDATPIQARQLLSALFYPQRAVWLGLAAIWFLILAFHFSQRPSSVRPTDFNANARYAANWSAHQAQLYAFLTQTDSYR